MTLGRLFGASVVAMTGLIAAWSLPGCGTDEAQNRDYGQPPDAAIFNPGLGQSSGGYGYGEGEVKPFVCPDALKRCTHTITFPFNGETSVELRGDFGGEETWVTGKPMTKKGGVWSVDLNVPFDKPIQFKFFLNGTTWTVDPAQPTAWLAEGLLP